MSPTTRSIRVAALATTGGALLAMGMVLAAPATGAPTTPQCFQAQSNVAAQENNVQTATASLSKHNLQLQFDANELAHDQAKVPTVPAEIAADEAKVAADQKLVNSDQASLRIAQANLDTAISVRDKACATTPTTAPPTTVTVPPTTVVPPPVGIPAQFGNCAQAARWGYANIPTTSRYYRLILDGDRDGIACETNGDDTRPVPPVVLPPTVIKHPPVVIPGSTVQAPPVVIPGQVIQQPPTYIPGGTIQVPSGSVNTGDGSLAAGR